MAVGGFDERYFCYVEDVDLGFRLRRLGRTCWYVPDAVAWHIGSATAGVGSAFAVYHGHRNVTWTFVKNMPGPLFWRYAPSHLAACLAGVAWFWWRGQLAAYLRAKRDALAGLPALWRERSAAVPLTAGQVHALGASMAGGSLFAAWRSRAGRAPTSSR
jgi:GT2 family glycosyltransferase